MQRLIIVLMLLLPALTVAQSEQDQKLEKRAQKRERPATQTQPNPTQPNPNYQYVVPYQEPYRYRPFRDGRSRRVNTRSVRSTQSTTTADKTKEALSFSLGFSAAVEQPIHSSVFGLYGTGGTKAFNLYISGGASQSNPYPYYDNITLADVIQWQDEAQPTRYEKRNIGLGARIKHHDNLYHIIGINIESQTRYLVYRDELNILTAEAEDQLYSIPGSETKWTNLTFGQTYMINRLELGCLIHFPTNPSLQTQLGYRF